MSSTSNINPKPCNTPKKYINGLSDMPLMQPNSIKKSYSKYKDIISFNKNIIIAAIITAIADVFIVNYAFMLYPTNYLLISIISLVADFIIFNFSFITFYFIDNKSKYVIKMVVKISKKLSRI